MPCILHNRQFLQPLGIDAVTAKFFCHDPGDSIHPPSPKGKLTDGWRKMHGVDKPSFSTLIYLKSCAPVRNVYCRTDRIYRSLASIFIITPFRLTTTGNPFFLRLATNMRPEASTALNIRSCSSLISSLVIYNP